jgi:hypothetical protein
MITKMAIFGNELLTFVVGVEVCEIKIAVVVVSLVFFVYGVIGFVIIVAACTRIGSNSLCTRNPEPCSTKVCQSRVGSSSFARSINLESPGR